MNIPLFTLLRKANKHVKAHRKAAAGRFLSPCRRIEFVYPPGERVCAMTFDDGPMALPPTPDIAGGLGLTSWLLDAMQDNGAHGTFDVIGSTEENYPDEEGSLHTHFILGRAYDHYARLGEDRSAGALCQTALLRRLVAEGHELANHSYRHILFGPNRTVYRSRQSWNTLDEVCADLSRLHELVLRETGQAMRLSRPPHYVDRIPDGHNAYDAYTRMGYHYMAANVDGGGWQASCGDYAKDVEAMVAPLRAALAQDPNSLSGAIIFQKDGYNMSLQTPVASALPLQLALLKEYGYRVVTVHELTALSPFEDLSPYDPCFSAACALELAGHVIGYRNNSCQPDRVLTRGELCQMAAPSAVFRSGAQPASRFSDVPVSHPYAAAVDWAWEAGLFAGAQLGANVPAAPDEIARAARLLGHAGALPKNNSRRAALLALSGQ